VVRNGTGRGKTDFPAVKSSSPVDFGGSFLEKKPQSQRKGEKNLDEGKAGEGRRGRERDRSSQLQDLVE